MTQADSTRTGQASRENPTAPAPEDGAPRAPQRQAAAGRAQQRALRLASGPLKREADTIEVMIDIYCRAHHAFERVDGGLCPRCRELNEYARKRLMCCPFGDEKPVCAKCRIHCYKPEQREMICEVMRFSGPKIMFTNPILAAEHLWRSLTKAAPDKPRNPKAATGAGKTQKGS